MEISKPMFLHPKKNCSLSLTMCETDLSPLFELVVIRSVIRYHLFHSKCLCHKKNSKFCTYQTQLSTKKLATVYGTQYNAQAAHLNVWCTLRPSKKQNLLDFTHLITPGEGDYVVVENSNKKTGPQFRSRVIRVKGQYIFSDVIYKFSKLILSIPKKQTKRTVLVSIKQSMTAHLQQQQLKNPQKYERFERKHIKAVIEKCMVSRHEYYDNISNYLMRYIYSPEWSMLMYILKF